MLIEEYKNKVKIECDEDILDINNEGISLEILTLTKNSIEDVRLNDILVEIFTKDDSNYIIETIDNQIAEELYEILIN